MSPRLQKIGSRKLYLIIDRLWARANCRGGEREVQVASDSCMLGSQDVVFGLVEKCTSKDVILRSHGSLPERCAINRR